MSTGGPDQAFRISEPARWLIVTLAAVLLLNVVLVGLMAIGGWPVKAAAELVAPRHVLRVFKHGGLDSWHAMAVAYRAHQADPGGDLYRVLFEDGEKFQYPPSSLLILRFVPDALIDASVTQRKDVHFSQAFTHAGATAVMLTILLSAACYLKGTGQINRWRERHDFNAIICVCVLLILGLCFYPLQKGQSLGQVQVYLGALAAFALFLFSLGQKAAAGVCLALCCLVKPQYAVLLGWGALRREWHFTMGMLATGTLGLMASLAVFGLTDHLRYLDVLIMLSRSGEVFWANQSINGILHRFLQTADPLVFGREFGAYNPFVYFLTALSAVAFLGSALYWPMRGGAATAQTRLVDLGLCLAASTLASPIAWEHHYGLFFPIFAIAAATLLALPDAQRRALAPFLLASYLLVANYLLIPEWWFADRWLGILGAHTFWGGLVLFVVLMRLARPAGQPASQAPR